MKPYALLLALAFGAALLLDAAGARAQRFPRELENIKMFGKGETIEFIFSQPFEGSPVVEHEKGAFSLSFSGTGSTKPVRSLRPVEESIYNEIKVVQNRYSTTVTFQLKDASQSLKDKLAFNSDKKTLRVSVNAPQQAAVTSPQGQATQSLLREMESRIAGGASAAAGGEAATAAAQEPSGGSLAMGDLGGSQFFYSLLTMVIALVIIVGGLYGLVYLYNRFLAARLRRFTGSHAIRQVASFHIGPRQRIVVLDINGEIIACGVTPSQITYLTHLGGQGPVGRKGMPGEGAPSAGDAPGGAGLQAPATGTADLPGAQGDPVHQFAEVLKQKVRSLKRIN